MAAGWCLVFAHCRMANNDDVLCNRIDGDDHVHVSEKICFCETERERERELEKESYHYENK